MQREKDCHREPDRHYEQRLPETGSDYPAVAVRPWRNEGNVPLAEESAAAVSDNACGGARTENIQNAAVAGENPSAEQDVYGHSAGDGGTVGLNMRVRDCQKCQKYVRKKWSDYYIPRNYHPIGMSHAYGWCNKHKKRCLEVRRCEVIPIGQISMEEAK